MNEERTSREIISCNYIVELNVYRYVFVQSIRQEGNEVTKTIQGPEEMREEEL